MKQKKYFSSELKKIFKKELKIIVKENDKIYDHIKWDSLGNFNILLACEKKFNFRFSNQEFSSINSFKEILKVVKKKIFKDKIENLFKNLKISRGDNILVHSNTAGIHQFLDDKKEKNLKFFIDLVLDIIGKKGTLLIPTYNYDFTRGKTFNRKKSPSQVGELGNFLIKLNSSNRTYEPVFSHIVFGKLKENLFNCNVKEAFGNKSIFNYILNKNFKILCFCCSPASMTFIHFIEKKINVNYRFDKYFKSYSIVNNKKIEAKYKYCVGKKNIDKSLKEKKIYKLLGSKLLMKDFGHFSCSQINTKILFNTVKSKLKKNNRFLINK